MDEGFDYVRYYGTVDMSDDTTGSHYTQAFLIGNANAVDGMLQAACSEAGTEDVNVFVEYSHDRTTWTAGTTDGDLDALGTTTVNDTLGIAAGVDQILYHNLIWARLHFDGQTGNGDTTVTWSVSLRKNDIVQERGRPVKVTAVANKSKLSPDSPVQSGCTGDVLSRAM